jgi:dTDP-glucose 4,6-dehydratase
VTVLGKVTYAGALANLEPVAGRFALVRGDICDTALLTEVLPGHDAVVNSPPRLTWTGRSPAQPISSPRTWPTCGCCSTRAVHVSTDEVDGSTAMLGTDLVALLTRPGLERQDPLPLERPA